MTMHTSPVSDLFKEIMRKIKSGELIERAKKMQMQPEKIEPIVLCCDDICELNETKIFTPSEFKDWLDEGEFACPNCEHECSASNLVVRCANCNSDIDYLDLGHLSFILGDTCPECAGRWGITELQQIHIHGSWSEAWYIYEWTEERMPIQAVSRKGRSDYWEAIVHFCTAEEFISIYRDRNIKALRTGLFKKPAVCLTEATRPNWDEIKTRHGEYGFVFRKREIIAINGAPAMYLPQSVLDNLETKGECIPELLQPYVNKISVPRLHGKTRHDFLHEREWRVPKSISFDGKHGVRPYAVIFPKERPMLPDENLILDAAREFHQLTDD